MVNVLPPPRAAWISALLCLALPLAAGAQSETTPPGRAAQGTDVLAERSKGSPSAPITVYEMSDFQCPYCRQHSVDVFPALERTYVTTGKVRWIFINFPLTSVHANAAAAAELALCGARQGKFWPLHDLIFKYQDAWAPLKEPGPFLLSLADSARVPRKPMETCLMTGSARPELEADAAGARRSGAQSTPTFYIEGGLLVGAQPVQVWKEILDSIYKAKSVNGKR
jgi:protein-disulfide isomerase